MANQRMTQTQLVRSLAESCEVNNKTARQMLDCLGRQLHRHGRVGRRHDSEFVAVRGGHREQGCMGVADPHPVVCGDRNEIRASESARQQQLASVASDRVDAVNQPPAGVGDPEDVVVERADEQLAGLRQRERRLRSVGREVRDGARACERPQTSWAGVRCRRSRRLPASLRTSRRRFPSGRRRRKWRTGWSRALRCRPPVRPTRDARCR